MTLEEIAIDLANDILNDFQALLVEKDGIKEYMNSWRAKEVREIIEEIKAGKVLKLRDKLDFAYNMMTDEIAEHHLLHQKLTILQNMVAKLVAKSEKL